MHTYGWRESLPNCRLNAERWCDGISRQNEHTHTHAICVFVPIRLLCSVALVNIVHISCLLFSFVGFVCLSVFLFVATWKEGIMMIKETENRFFALTVFVYRRLLLYSCWENSGLRIDEQLNGSSFLYLTQIHTYFCLFEKRDLVPMWKVLSVRPLRLTLVPKHISEVNSSIEENL